MNIQDLNDLANEIVVARISIQQAEDRIAQIMEENPEIRAWQAIVESSKMQKESAQNALMDAMAKNDLKSWKTEQANFARVSRFSVTLDPRHKKQVEGMLKTGVEVEGFSLNSTEYISIKLNK